MTSATIGATTYHLELTNGRHTFGADEPVSVGGTDLAPAPDELLEASLASCAAITLRMYANRKNWQVDQVTVSVSLQRENGTTVFTETIHITGSIGPEEKQRLVQIARACPVSKSLLGTIEINAMLND